MAFLLKRWLSNGLLTILCWCCTHTPVLAQSKETDQQPSYRIALFAPLYLDSLFTDNNYRYSTKFPRFALPGIDFVQGAQIAMDSIFAFKEKIEVTIYDSKSKSKPLSSLISSKKLDRYNLIIGSVKDDEFLQLAIFAQEQHIPFVSATYPNDGGVTANPYLIIANSTLQSHCEAIFSLLLQNHGADNIIHVRQTGAQEDRVAGYFTALNKPDNKPLLSIKTVTLDSNFNNIKKSLDSTRKNIIVGGSLDEEFVTNIATAIQGLKKKYNITLIGMPNWNGFSVFSADKKDAIKDLAFLYTSPYYNNKTDAYSKMLQESYLQKYKGYPSDMAYKGFEMIYLFADVLLNHSTDFNSHLNELSSTIFSKYHFLPVYRSKNTSTPDFFENKHLYFIQRLNGVNTKY